MTHTNRTLVTRAVGIVVAMSGAAGIALSLWGSPLARAQNLGSPAFANPPEIRSRDAEKRLRAVMQLSSGKYSIPNVGTATLRQFRGWDPANPAPPPSTDISSGPTLRARQGDLVEISFLNKIDDSQFSYTFDTSSKPGYSSFGCDQSGTVYPGKDIFPNCFHGSSTANIHFHGTHTTPDGLGDNVLVQILPQVNQPDWTSTFNTLFNSGKIPQHWNDMPADYKTKQMDMIKAYDTQAKAQAVKNGLPPPDSLYDADKKRIDAGEWPQYLVGAFPNFFELPTYPGKYAAGQAPGTHWYHTHKHGSTSMHILNGLAGALIIESTQPDGYDQTIRGFYNWGNSYGDHEKIVVFHQFDTTQNLQRSPNAPPGKGIKQVLVNGKLTPTITMRPGEVQLWRFVNATEGNNAGKLTSSLFQTPGFKFTQTAQDGVQFSPTSYKNQPFLNGTGSTGPNGGQVPGGLALAGGNRADVLVQAPTTTGVSTFSTGGLGTNGTPLFFVNVTGAPVTYPNGPFPTTWPNMPKYLDDLPKPGPNDKTNPGSPVKFQWEAGRVQAPPTTTPPNNNPPHFMINGKQFEQTGPIVDQCMPLNGLQDWVLENWTSTSHPFHIHINPFQIIKIETPTALNTYTTYAPTDNYIWQDVIALPPAVISTDGTQISPGRVTIRQTYLDFVGTFVLHCHILAHEDRGMMQLVRIVPEALYPKGCQANIPGHH